MQKKFPIYQELQDAFLFFNKNLFNNELPLCIVTLHENWAFNGIFKANSYLNGDGEFLHEIGMNVFMMALREIKDTLATLVHEMVHLKTFVLDEFGEANGYHNKYFAQYMRDVGLPASDTGKEGGKETGRSIHHYIIAGGLFDKKVEEFLNSGYFLSFVKNMQGRFNEVGRFSQKQIKRVGQREYEDEDGNKIEGRGVVLEGRGGDDEKTVVIIEEKKKGKKNGVKVGYVCDCGCHVFGKDDLEMKCLKCDSVFKRSLVFP